MLVEVCRADSSSMSASAFAAILKADGAIVAQQRHAESSPGATLCLSYLYIVCYADAHRHRQQNAQLPVVPAKLAAGEMRQRIMREAL